MRTVAPKCHVGVDGMPASLAIGAPSSSSTAMSSEGSGVPFSRRYVTTVFDPFDAAYSSLVKTTDDAIGRGAAMMRPSRSTVVTAMVDDTLSTISTSQLRPFQMTFGFDPVPK